ncbi:MAG: polysaccharide deacetylase family protein [Bacteroidota bacterium]
MLLVYTDKATPRLSYILRLMLGLAGFEFRITHSEEEFAAYTGARLSYCDKPFSNEPFIFASRLLFEKGIEDQQINVFEWKEVPVFFGTHPKYEIPFDPFAAAFYLVSRYEEYLPHIKDQHLRFSPHQSLAYQRNFLDKPLVNIWAAKLRDVLLKHYPDLKYKTLQYKFISTIDVDSAFAYKEKGMTRQFGAFVLNLFEFNFRRVAERFRVLAGFEKDPYDTYEYLLNLKKNYHLKQIYFFLVGNYGEFDKNVSIESSMKFQSLIKSIADYADVAVHPSYASNTNPEQLRKEIRRLSKVLKREVIKSRQHYLKVVFPATYRNLIENDIKEDYSMGYASEIGFRASICTPFPFYDLDMDTETRLLLYPFMLMDNTLKDYLKLTPDESLERALKLIEEVRKVNGTFITLWHNHSVNDKDEWQGWRRVYEAIIEAAN